MLYRMMVCVIFLVTLNIWMIYIDGLGHKPFKSGQAFFSER